MASQNIKLGQFGHLSPSERSQVSMPRYLRSESSSIQQQQQQSGLSHFMILYYLLSSPVSWVVLPTRTENFLPPLGEPPVKRQRTTKHMKWNRPDLEYSNIKGSLRSCLLGRSTFLSSGFLKLNASKFYPDHNKSWCKPKKTFC